MSEIFLVVDIFSIDLYSFFPRILLLYYVPAYKEDAATAGQGYCESLRDIKDNPIVTRQIIRSFFIS